MLAAGLLAGALLAACGAPVAGTGPEAAVPLDAHVFGTQRPSWPDCSKVDVAALGELSRLEIPAGTAQLELLDPKRPELTWGRCVGLTPLTQAADGSVTGGATVWFVSFATSPEATTNDERVPSMAPAPSMRALVRPARLGDARAEVLLDVHADTHDTVVLVTVFDPGTGRAAATCAVASARGDEAERVADWCLKSVADQLAKPWLKRPTPSPSASRSPSASGSPSGSGAPSGSGSPSAPAAPTGGAAPTGAASPTVTVTVTAGASGSA